MNFLDFFVFLCVLLGVVSAALVAFHPNILYAAVSLMGALLAVAGLYASLGADFLAATQLIIYVGGVIIVILFAVMMSENIYRIRFLEGAQKILMPFIMSAVILGGLLALFRGTSWGQLLIPLREPTAEVMGRALTGPYALVFQYVAIVLLFGLIGAVVVARPDHATKNKEGK
ncbi:MAG: NADH-quinone oxidoreductase subunit J [Proteobacteria bacterium]|nr:NADH-quinone oxidoreductase subunit J [Pseudomonadota bacterium]